jgi:hypothetical protein
VRLLLVAARVRRMPTYHHESFIDTLPLTNQRGLRSVEFKTCHLTSGIQSRPVAIGGNKWQTVTSSANKWHPVTSSGNRCLLVAVRSHFGLRLGRINPDTPSPGKIFFFSNAFSQTHSLRDPYKTFPSSFARLNLDTNIKNTSSIR